MNIILALFIILGSYSLGYGQGVYKCGWNQTCYYSSLKEALEKDSKEVKYLEISPSDSKAWTTTILQFKNLKALCINDSSLTEIPCSVQQLRKLQALTIKQASLKEFPTAITALKRLKYLAIEGNGTQNLQGLSCFQQLEVLHLEGGRLKTLPTVVFTLKKLKRLTVKGTALAKVTLPTKIKSSLEVIDWRDNQLYELPSTMDKLTFLRQLYLTNNELTALPATIADLDSLQIVEVANNQLDSLPDSFLSIIGLVELDLRNNKLKDLPRIHPYEGMIEPNVEWLYKSLDVRGNAFTPTTTTALKEYFLVSGFDREDGVKFLID